MALPINPNKLTAFSATNESANSIIINAWSSPSGVRSFVQSICK